MQFSTWMQLRLKRKCAKLIFDSRYECGLCLCPPKICIQINRNILYNWNFFRVFSVCFMFFPMNLFNVSSAAADATATTDVSGGISSIWCHLHFVCLRDCVFFSGENEWKIMQAIKNYSRSILKQINVKQVIIERGRPHRLFKFRRLESVTAKP